MSQPANTLLEEALEAWTYAREGVIEHQLIRRFDGNYGTRLAWMHHGVSHEEYHRGQLAMYARAMGLVPALTQLIQASG